MSRSTWPIVIASGCFTVYAAVVTTLWLIGRPTPPAAVGSVFAALFVAATIMSATRAVLGALSRCAGRQELDALAKRVHDLEVVVVAMARRGERVPAAGAREPLAGYLEEAAELFELGRRVEQERRRREDDEG